MIRVAITGGAGLLGSHLISQLSSEDCHIRIVDNLTSGHSSNVQNVRGWLDMRMGDICQSEVLIDAFKDVDLVYHLAAQTDPMAAWAAPNVTAKINIEGTLSVVRACALNKVKRLVYASCHSVYGEGNKKPISEESPLHPMSPIGITKAAGESYCRAWGGRSGFEVVILRLFDVYGPTKQLTFNDNRMMQNIVQSISLGKPVLIPDINSIHDLVYAEDAARAFAVAGTKKEAAGRTINVGTGNGTRYTEIVSTLEKIAERSVQKMNRESEYGVVTYSVADNALAQEVLGWSPTISVEEGLRRTLRREV